MLSPLQGTRSRVRLSRGGARLVSLQGWKPRCHLSIETRKYLRIWEKMAQRQSCQNQEWEVGAEGAQEVLNGALLMCVWRELLN